MILKLVKWLIGRYLKGYHLHRNPTYKTKVEQVINSLADLAEATVPEGEQ